MGKFKTMSKKQTQEMDELLHAADAIIGSSTPVIKGNPQMAKAVGTAIGGAMGAAIAASAGAVGVSGSIAAAGLGAAASAGAVGFSGSIAAGGLGAAAVAGGGVAAVAALPVAIVALITGGIGMLIGKNKAKKKEMLKQAEYVKEITEKQQQLYEKYKDLKREYERTSKEKDDIIKQQQEKLAEYDALFGALKKNRDIWESNLSAA